MTQTKANERTSRRFSWAPELCAHRLPFWACLPTFQISFTSLSSNRFTRAMDVRHEPSVEEVLAYIAQSTPIRADWVEKQPIDHTYFGLNRRWNKKWMALFPHLVVWYRHPRAVPRGYMILAANTAAAEDAAKGTSIEVVSPTGRKLRFRSSNAMGNAAWLADLRAVLMERLRELASHTEASAVQQHMNARRSIAMTAAPSYAIAPPPPPPPSLLHNLPSAASRLDVLGGSRGIATVRGGGRGRRGVL